MHCDPVFGQAFQAGDLVADFVVQDLRAAAGDGVESGIAQSLDGVRDAQTADRPKWMISEAEKQCRCTWGKRCLMPRSNSSYHSSFRSGWRPPCMSTPVPPISTVSRTFS